jgi:MFS family permease
MHLAPYRRVLALPGLRPLLLLALVARVPVTAAPIALTLHVVLDLGGSYTAAGAVGAVSTLTSAIGAPLLGRLVDRRSLRFTLAISVVAEGAFWAVAPVLPYPALLVAAALAGFATMPVFSAVRQSVAALVPETQRREAYALDSIAVELSYMVGPAAAVVLVTQTSSTAAMYVIGALIVLGGIGFYVQNPPVRSPDDLVPTEPISRRTWLRTPFVALLLLSVAVTTVISATDLAIVADLREAGQVGWIGIVIAAWCAASIVGGLVYGAVRRTLPTAVLVALLGGLTIPVSLASGAGWLALAILLPGMLVASTLSALADSISRMVPASARGEAMGLYTSAITLGLAAGAPVAGFIIDRWGPEWAFASVGALGLGVALVLLPFTGERVSDRRGPDLPGPDSLGVKSAVPVPAPAPASHDGERAATGTAATTAERLLTAP